MPRGSSRPATAIANPHTDNTSRMMSASCRSCFVNWAIMGHSSLQATGCRQFSLSNHAGTSYRVRSDGSCISRGEATPLLRLDPDGAFLVLRLAGPNGTSALSLRLNCTVASVTLVEQEVMRCNASPSSFWVFTTQVAIFPLSLFLS